jgi:SAM-dependent methyltransferase
VITPPINQIEDTARWGVSWQRSRDWSSHTVDETAALKLVPAYLRLLRAVARRKYNRPIRGLGIGSGAGYLEAAMTKHGIRMVASEWSEDGLQLIEAENPQLERRQVDLLDFADKDSWDLILCREVYLFTRTNAFSRQMEILSRLLDALAPGGILLLIGSDVAYPHCINYRLMCRCLRTDPRVAKIFGPVLEAGAKRVRIIPMSKTSYRIMNALFETVFFAVNAFAGRKLAAIRIYVVVKAI